MSTAQLREQLAIASKLVIQRYIEEVRQAWYAADDFDNDSPFESFQLPDDSHAEKALENLTQLAAYGDLKKPTEDLGDPCICERCQAEHYGGNYFLCPDCEHA
mgnify:FL=1|jgi:hypothetical protein